MHAAIFPAPAPAPAREHPVSKVTNIAATSARTLIHGTVPLKYPWRVRRSLLIGAFALLLLLDVRSVIEVSKWILVHHEGPMERDSAGLLHDPAIFTWGAYMLATAFNLGVLWLTIRVGRRLWGPSAELTPSGLGR
jgi:hypothetical protein